MALKSPFARDIQEAKEQLENILQDDLDWYRDRKIKCRSCGKQSAAKLWVFIQTHWFDDDPYNPSHIQCDWKDCKLNCPKCWEDNRIYMHPQQATIGELYERSKPFLLSNDGLVFASVVQEYK